MNTNFSSKNYHKIIMLYKCYIDELNMNLNFVTKLNY